MQSLRKLMIMVYGKEDIMMKKSKKDFLKRSKGDKIFDAVNIIIMILLCMSTLYPFLYLIKVSISGPLAKVGSISIIPEDITFDSYIKVLNAGYIVNAFWMTIKRTVLGSFINLLAIVCTAYPLSKKYLPNRNMWTKIIVFTMFFGGGLIPTYLLVDQLHLRNSIWALILPGLVPTFSMIIARNFFMAIPSEMEESAKIDGANDIHILFRIILPVSKPILATLLLWVAVGHWNAWFDSLIYIDSSKNQVLQVITRRIVLEGSQAMMQQIQNMEASAEEVTQTPESLKAATTIITTLPILMVYPFLQKHFAKGVMVGSLKG